MKVAEIPDKQTIFDGLMSKYLQGFTGIDLGRTTKFTYSHNLDLAKLKQSIDESLQKFGTHYWQSANGQSTNYYGFSLAYNPDHQDGLDINGSSLGTPKNSSDQFFYGSFQNHEVLKNSYFDAYGFRLRTPAASHGYLNEVLNTCKRSIIRSRMMILDGSNQTQAGIEIVKKAKPGDSRFGWHRDEVIYKNLRINIPVYGDENYVFEMEGDQPYVLERGFAYSWDTNIAHRVFCTKPTKIKRYNLVIGVSPWFDYIKEEDAWVPNEYCGKVSPFEMLNEGLIFPWLKKDTLAASRSA
jgi:hypothetical protein